MGVDSNVLIFERIKEELAKGRSQRASVIAGFDRVWVTIVDTHVTSLIAAALLFQFGTSPIRGFATTLTIGLIANVFTAVFASRTLFELMLWRRGAGAGPLSLVGRARAFTNTTFDFIRWSRPAIFLSLLLISAGVVGTATRGIPLGIDFSGGTLVVVEFAQQGVSEDDVRGAVAPIPGDEVVQRYGPAADRQFLIRLPLARTADKDASLEAGARQVAQALQHAKLPQFRIVNRELVSAVIGEDLQWRGIYATAGSMAAIAIYLASRFRFSFAVGAIAATVHDILVTLACLSLAGYDLSLNVTAALLTVIGYSVNDTIVIFDRVRENMKAMRGELADCRGQSQRESDVVTNVHHCRHDASLRPLAVPVRRRGPARFRLRHAGGHRERHLFHGVHRLGDCHPTERALARRIVNSAEARPIQLSSCDEPRPRATVTGFLAA